MKEWFKTKVSEIGEKAVDSVVKIVLSNNDSSSISNFHNTPLVTAIKKSINSKVHIKQPNVVYNGECSGESLCHMKLLVSEGIFLLLPDGTMPTSMSPDNIRRRYHGLRPSTPSSAVGDPSTPNEVTPNSRVGIDPHRRWDDRKGRLEFQPFGFVKANKCRYRVTVETNAKVSSSETLDMEDDVMNRVVWDHLYEDDLHDIGDDITITLSCDLDVTKYLNDPFDVTPKSFNRPPQPRKISGGQPIIYTPKKASNNGYYTQNVGRAIISLPLLIESLQGKYITHIKADDLPSPHAQGNGSQGLDTRNKSDPQERSSENFGVVSGDTNVEGTKDSSFLQESAVKSGTCSNGFTTRMSVWLQLLPMNEHKLDRSKYVRPFSGYPLYGMKNPLYSLGYILVTIEIDWFKPPFYLSLANDIRPPVQEWVVQPKFELLHFMSIADRFIYLYYNKPFWVTNLLAPTEYNPNDIIFIFIFWLLLFNLIVNTDIVALPLSLLFIVLFLSLYYKHTKQRRKNFNYSTIQLPNDDIKFTTGGGKNLVTIYASSKQKGTQLLTSSPSRGSPYLTPELVTSSPAGNSPKSLVCVTPVEGNGSGVSDIHNKSNTEEQGVSDIGGTSLDTNLVEGSSAQDKVAESLPESPNYLAVPEEDVSQVSDTGDLVSSTVSDANPVEGTAEQREVKSSGESAFPDLASESSAIKTICGEHRLSITRGMDEACAIFSDDKAEVDVSGMLEVGFWVLNRTQSFLGHLVVFIEKMKYSLIWESSAETLVNLFMIGSLLLPLYILSYLLMVVPFKMWRFIAFTILMFHCLFPQYLKFNVDNLLRKDLHGSPNELLKLLQLIKNWYRNWYTRLPDQREIDHRDICSLQAIDRLTRLLPSDHYINWELYRNTLHAQFNELKGKWNINAHTKAISNIERQIIKEYFKF